MNPILLSFALVPFLASRTTLALGLALLWSSIHTRPPTMAQALINVVCAVGLIVLQLVVGSTRSFVDSWTATYGWLTRAVDLFATVVASAAVARIVLSSDGREMHLGWALAVGAFALAFALLRERVIVLFNVVAIIHEPRVKHAFLLNDFIWAFFGVWLSFNFPAVGFGVSIAATCALALIAWLMSRFRRASYRACEACKTRLHGAASVCPKCHSTRAPLRIGAMGRVIERPPKALADHRLMLLAARRCPSCAEQILNVEGTVSCAACMVPPLSDRAEVVAFVAYTDNRMMLMLPIFAVMGFVPVLGLGAALLMYQLSPASAASSYVTRRERVGSRLIRAAGLLALATIQPVPILGAAAAAGIVSVIHFWNRQRFAAREAIR